MTMDNSGGYPAPVPVRKSNSNCLIGGLIGCGVLVVLVVIVGALGMRGLSKSGAMKGVMNSATSMQTAANSLMPISTAIESYRGDHKGAYPKSLSDLVPKYVQDKAELSCSVGGDTVPMVYSAPSPDAPGYTVVISVHTGTMAFGGVERVEMLMALLKDNTVAQEQLTVNAALSGGRTR